MKETQNEENNIASVFSNLFFLLVNTQTKYNVQMLYTAVSFFFPTWYLFKMRKKNSQLSNNELYIFKKNSKLAKIDIQFEMQPK